MVPPAGVELASAGQFQPGDFGFKGLPGFVQAEFQQSESPLGLIVDWSMAFPVACGTVSGSPASLRPALARTSAPHSSLVLIRINGNDVLPGTPREKLQAMLSERPLALLFEHARHITGLVAPPPWRRQPKDVLSSQELTLEPGSFSLALPSQEQERKPFLEEHPERSPLTRWGRLERAPPSFSTFGSTALSLKRTKTQLSLPRLPGIGFGASTEAPSTLGANRSAGASAKSPMRTTWGGAAGFGLPRDMPQGMLVPAGNSTGSKSLPQGSRQVSKSRSMTQLPASTPHSVLDLSYQQLVDKAYGAGPPSQWPLGHDARYPCHIEDMRLVARLWDAYDVGFRGRKRARPTVEELQYGVFSPRAKTVETAMVNKDGPEGWGEFPQAWCDTCGKDLNGSYMNPSYLWYCRKCKSRGSRFELCLECHASEVLQAEGKHGSAAAHPHFINCEHRSLIKHRDLRSAYPGLPLLRAIICDLCGSYVPGLRGGDDRVAVPGHHTHVLKDRRSEAATRDPFKIPGSGEVYVCPCCPEDRGLRFELCEFCAHSLLDFGTGIQRLSELIT